MRTQIVGKSAKGGMFRFRFSEGEDELEGV